MTIEAVQTDRVTEGALAAICIHKVCTIFPCHVLMTSSWERSAVFPNCMFTAIEMRETESIENTEQKRGMRQYM